MMPNPIRWIVFTLLLVAGAVALTFTKGISLGADLEGGTRLVYSLPLEDIKRDDPNATPDEVVRRTLDVMAKRVDSLGLREISIVAHGDDEIVVELPGLSELEVANIKDTITSLGRLEWRIVAGPEDPFHLDQEQKKLADYLDGAAVKARADEWEKLPADRKDIRFWVDLVRAFNAGEGTAGPAPGLRWYVANPGGRSFDKKNLRRLTAVDFHPMRIDEKLDPVRGDRFVFRGEDIAEVRPTRGEKGVVVFFRLVAEKRAAFGEFTGSNVNRFLAVILNDVVDTEARIKSELPGEGIIESGSIGGYAPEEVKALVTVLNTGSLRVKPRLESESRIGASLGEDSIRLGILSSVLSIAATFAFMFVYYRKAGIVAAISILVNGAVLLGVLSLYGATLTLPGIGGFILTLAMAVDSNILIYERIREERDKGRGVDQAVRLGFERAFVTIVDSNLTTLLTSVVLLWIGTGPIKGLGLTLSVGILTTLFAALVFTKAIFAWLLDHKRLPEVRMLRLFKQTPNLRFIRIWKMTVTVSVLTSVAGLVAFLSAPESVYGIDFVGGASARIRLADAITLADARETLAGLPGFGTPDVTPSLGGESSAGGGRYREFVVKGKLSREKREQMKAEPVGKSQEIVDNFRRGIRQVMGPKMVPDPITDLALAPSSASAPSGGSAAGKASLTLHYAGSAVLDDVRARLATSAMLSDVQVAEVPGDPRAVRVTGTAPASLTEAELTTRLPAYVDRAGGVRLSEPFPEINTVKPRVAKTLKNKAILSLLVAFAGMILYVRFRFQEYRYGVGAVIAIIHDLVVTLGIVAIANITGLVDVEIDMTMIAVFLTIAGYSVNDTIVIYDRIRENLGKTEGRKPLAIMVDEACNQTLSRTLLTATAAWFASLLMFAINRGKHNPLEGFGFTMMVGIMSGTYSSIWVASLFVVAVEKYRGWKEGGRGGDTREAAPPAGGGGGRAAVTPPPVAAKA